MHGRGGGAQLDRQPDSLLRSQGLEQREHRPDQHIGIQGQAGLGQRPRGATQLLDDIAGAQRLQGDRLDDAQRLEVMIGIPAQQRGDPFGVGGDRRQRLIHLVGKAGRQFAQYVPVGGTGQCMPRGGGLRGPSGQLIMASVHTVADPKLPRIGTL